MTAPTSTSVIVVGGGAMGLATGWALSRAGERPIVLERFARGHTEGASHGATRNFNDAYAEDAYLDLLVRAKELWSDLSDGLDEPLLRLHGLVSHGDDAQIARVHAAHITRGINSVILNPSDAESRWPGMRFASDVLYSPNAGVARASAALTALERRIVVAGGEVRWNTQVVDINDLGDRVEVRLADGTILTAETVVVTAGAWSRSLVPASIALPTLTVTEETPAHFAARDSGIPWPSFNHFLDGSAYPGDVYGMPTPGEGVKIGFHRVGAVIDPDARPHTPTWQAELREYAERFFPGLDADTAVPISCTYTSTDDGEFVLDRVGRIVVGAGFSGHGFKFTPAIGETLASLALDERARPAALFRLGR